MLGGGNQFTKFPCSAYISPRERLQLTCRVVIKGRFAPWSNRALDNGIMDNSKIAVYLSTFHSSH